MAMNTTPDNFYQKQKSALLKNHDKLLGYGIEMMNTQYGKVFTSEVVQEAHREFENLIPQIPYIGGKANPLTDTLVQMTSLLALYRVMEARGISAAEVGDLVGRMAQNQIDHFPKLARRLIGRLYMTRFWRNRTKRLALQSQQGDFPGNFVYEVVEGDGQETVWGVNYLECGVVKFFHDQGADEFTPYMCLIDYLMFPGMGIQLERTGTIAHGCTHCDFRFKKGNVT